MKIDAANRRDLRLWQVCVDDVVSQSFELIVAQNYAPVPIGKGETAREVAKEWCAKREIPEPECDMISATICREAVARGFASSTPAKPTGIQVTEGSRVMARRDGSFQRGVARSVTGKFVAVLFDDGQHQNTSVWDVRALPSPKEPPSSNPSYVWAAVAALQALVLGLVVLRDHRRLRAPEPVAAREVSPTPIVPKARDWGARRRRESARRRASSSTLGSTAAAGVGAGRGFGRGFRGAVVPFAWPCRGRASAWAPRCRGGALPCGGALPGPGCRRAAPSAGGRRGAGAAPPAWRGGALPSAGGRGLDGCRRGAPFAAAARALARRAASWDIGGRGGCGALGLGAVDLAARSVSWTARLMMRFYWSVMAGVERCGHGCVAASSRGFTIAGRVCHRSSPS